jgi:SAM-dependent methyltransferase
VSLELARRVGSSGRVVGVDMDAVKLDVACERAAAEQLDNVRFEVADVYQHIAADAFDLVYCRNVLQHLSRPVEVLRTMWQAVGAGGVLVVEDADFEGSFCYPPDDGFEFWVDRYQQALRSFGGDPLCGRRLVTRFAEAGIPSPEIGVVQRVDVTGEAKSLPLLTVEATAEAMLEAGVATAEQIAAATERLSVLAADTSTLVGSPRLFQAWARRSTGSVLG